MVSVSISRECINGWSFDTPPDHHAGAELVFTGLVRDELEKIGMAAVEKFGIIDLHCIHRVGAIPAGEAAIVVLVRSKHRQEVFSAMSWFMDELKRAVPIWKVGRVQ